MTRFIKEGNARAQRLKPGDRVMFASSSIPKDGQQWPGFGDTGTVLEVYPEAGEFDPLGEAVINWDREAIKDPRESISILWDSKDPAAGVGMALAGVVS